MTTKEAMNNPYIVGAVFIVCGIAFAWKLGYIDLSSKEISVVKHVKQSVPSIVSDITGIRMVPPVSGDPFAIDLHDEDDDFEIPGISPDEAFNNPVHLQGVSYASSGSRALVNGKVVRVGDFIHGKVLKEIHEKFIVIGSDDPVSVYIER